MNSNPSFRLLLVLGIAVLTVVSLATPAAAITVDTSDAPDRAETGSDVVVTFTFDELYAGDAPRTWNLNATTELENASWEIRTLDSAGDDIDVVEEAGNATDHWVEADAGVDTVEVTLRGTVPEIETFSYDPEERITLATFTMVREGGGSSAIEEVPLHQYTEESAAARNAIEEAQGAIDEAAEQDGDTASAERTLQNAIDAYNDGSHGLAVTLAEEAAEEADEAVSGAQQLDLVLFAVAGVIGVGVLAGLVVWYRSRRSGADKLG